VKYRPLPKEMKIKSLIISILVIPLILFIGIYIFSTHIESRIENYYNYFILHIIVVVEIVFFVMLWDLYSLLDYREYLNSKSEINKLEHLIFERVNTELFILGLIILTASASFMFVPFYDFESKIIILLTGCAMSIVTLYVSISNSLRWAKIFCIIYTSIITPLTLFLFMYIAVIFKDDVRHTILYEIVTIGLFLITSYNITVYRSYLNIKFKKEMKILTI
jgi:hypothetical protein